MYKIHNYIYIYRFKENFTGQPKQWVPVYIFPPHTNPLIYPFAVHNKSHRFLCLFCPILVLLVKTKS